MYQKRLKTSGEDGDEAEDGAAEGKSSGSRRGGLVSGATTFSAVFAFQFAAFRDCVWTFVFQLWQKIKEGDDDDDDKPGTMSDSDEDGAADDTAAVGTLWMFSNHTSASKLSIHAHFFFRTWKKWARIELVDWLIGSLIVRSIDWLIGTLIDRYTDWLIDWLIDWLGGIF